MAKKEQGLSTKALHGDHEYAKEPSVAPPISVATTFRAPAPEERAASGTADWNPADPTHDIYSRYTQPTLTRTEKALSAVIGAPTVVYPSGIAATWAILLLVRPDVIAITDGYHGVHACFEVYRKVRGAGQVEIIKLDDDFARYNGKTLLCWLETPLNPTGESRSIAHYAEKTHKHGGQLAIDSTFAPPPLQDPFKWGADIVMHSGTKYFGGHSDALSGTVSVKTDKEWQQLWHSRTYTGANLGSLESWLVLRSIRTLEVRVKKQSQTATALAQWLTSLTRAAPGSNLDGPAGVVEKVWHTCLQGDKGGKEWIGEGAQMTSGPACFAMLLTKPAYATHVGHKTKLFIPATSLGGVESLLEQRCMSDETADPRLIRLSIGLEDFEDLKADLIQAFEEVVKLDTKL